MTSRENLFLNQEEKSSEKDKAKHALEQLFSLARKYRSGKAYFELIKFVSQFRFYSPFNAMLVHVQMPHAKFATSAQRWASRYGYVIKPSAKPLVILQPMGPVMFVFDVSDVEPGPNAIPLPPDVTMPFEVRGGRIGKELDCLLENCKRDRIKIDMKKEGGFICRIYSTSRDWEIYTPECLQRKRSRWPCCFCENPSAILDDC